MSVVHCWLFASGRPHDIPNMAATASWSAAGGKQLSERISLGLSAAGSCSPADHRRYATFPVPVGHVQGTQQHASPTANGSTSCVDSQYHTVPCCDPMVKKLVDLSLLSRTGARLSESLRRNKTYLLVDITEEDNWFLRVILLGNSSGGVKWG